jgi:hypothetical protein
MVPPRSLLPRSGRLLYGALLVLTVPFLALSWRRWPDEIVDSGRELYTAWRLSCGERLYREVDGVYGPLAQEWNGVLFRCFGPGLMTLVVSNLVVWAVVLGLVVFLFRRAWGRRGAAVAGAGFVTLCSFTQLGETGNYNYAFPYAHEVTQGMLAVLALTVGVSSWLRSGRAAWAGWAGFCWGLCWVLKPEFILAGGLVGIAGLVLALRRGTPVTREWVLPAAVGTVLPTLLFAARFARDGEWTQGWRDATTAWRMVVSGGAVDPRFQAVLSGWNAPWANLREHLESTAGVLLALLVLTFLAARIGAMRQPIFRLCSAVTGLSVLFLLARQPHVGDGLPRSWLGLVLAYLSLIAWRCSATRPERLLLAVLAAGLMARMMLYGRLHHFGFYQAALALMVLSAVLVVEWPRVLPSDLGAGRRFLVLAALVMLAGFGSQVVTASRVELGSRVLTVGTGADAFRARPLPRPFGAWLNFAQEVLRREGATGTLLVVPEGLMLNYLTRLPNPIPPFFLFSFALRGDAEAALVRQLEAKPPDWIVALSRDLREYGISRYGDREGEGKRLLAWIDRDYELVASAEQRHPFDSPEGDLWVLRRRTAPGMKDP